MSPRAASEECPNCGAAVPAGRLACPECGSDANTGWKDADEIDYQSIELPDGDGELAPRRSRAMFWVILVTVVAFLVAVALWR